MAYLEDYGQILLFSQILRGRELSDHLRAMEAYVLRTFSIDDLVIIPMRDHCKYPGGTSCLYNIVILIQFSSTLLCILILSRCGLHSSFSVHRLVSHDMSNLVPVGDVRGLILIWGCLWIEFLSDSDLLVFLVPLAPRPLPSTLPPRFRAHEFCAYHQMAGHHTDYCASLRHTIQDLIDSGAVSFPVSTTNIDLAPNMTANSFPA